ncbi:MAG: hypothetical protein PWQ87_402, partial [Candidatus Woesearchaeota archaeon]|nr:hypothetical protein [Candidatus Woesearchaeota archaeon]
MQLSKENLLVIGVFIILLVLLSSQVINAFQASSANYYIRRTTTGIAGAEQSDGSRSLGTAYQSGANATGTNLEANIGFFEPYSAFYCTQNIDCPDGYFCNINQFCQEKLSDGQTCIGATFESTPLSEDEACSSGYCDNDAVGKEDDGWCFTTESGIYDNQDHKCEKSASPSLDDYSDELRNECHDTFGFVDDSCVFYSDGDDNNETCHCVPDATTGDLGKDWSIGGEITDCCGDDASEYYLESIYHLSLDSLVEYSDACCYSASSCIFNDSCYASGNVDYDIDEDGDKDYCNAGTWFDCNTDAECGEGYFCSNNDCVVLPTPSVDSVTPLTNYSLNSELGGFKIIVSGDRPTGYIYELQRDSNTIYTSSSTEYIDAGLSDNSRHCYRVRLTDEVSHYSEWSDELCNITSDRTGPASPSIALTPSNDANDNILISIAEQDDGLVLYLPFEEGSGSIARDWSPEHNDGTIYGASWTDGNNDPYTGKALSFDGVDDKVVIGTTGRPTNTFTFGGWFKTSVTHQIDPESTSGTVGTSGQRYAFGAENKGTNGGAGLSVGTNGISVYEHGDYYMPAIAVYASDIGTDWNHIIVVYNNKQPTIYLNGVAVHTGLTSPKSLVYAPIEIGGGAYGYFNGLIDEVVIYNRSLSQEEIINLYQSGLIQHGISRANASTSTYAPVDGLYDDFNDGDYTSNPTWTVTAGSWEVSNGYLRTTGSQSKIYTPSTQAYGIWEWDMKQTEKQEFWLTNNNQNMYMSAGQGYLIYFYGGRIYFKRSTGSTTYELGSVPNTNDGSWAHFKVIRHPNGNFKVYKNDVLIFDVTDNTYTTSSYTGMFAWDVSAGNGGYDNIRLTPLVADINYIDEDADDKTPPETPSAPTVDAISLSELKVSWIDVPDYGDDYWYYTKSYDDEGNIDNFVEHPGFEDGVDHSSGSFGDYRITSEESYSGYYSLYANGSFEYEIHPDYRLFEPGHTYMLSAWVKEDPGCTECNQYLHSRWYFEDGSATTTSGGDVPNDGNWHYTFVVKTIPTGHGKVTGYNWYVGYDTNANSFRYIDNLEIKEVKSATLTSGVKDYFISGTGAGTYATTSPYTASGLNCFDYNCYTVAARDNALNQGPASPSTCEYPISAIICDYGGGPEGYCYNASSTICYYNGTGCPTCQLACQGVGTTCCPYQNTARDNVTCSSTGCDYTDHDRDEAEGYCTSDADGCTPFYWSIGGEIANCCGDDANEYRIINTFDATMDAISDLSDACCNSETKCVYNDTCYPNDAQGVDVDMDGDKDYCIAGTWFDCNTDAECNTAGGYHCVNNDCTLGCNANADCPENYFCNSSNKCHPKLIDGEICVGVTAESTPSSEDEACVSGYCDNDALGDPDDNWCFTPHNIYYDGNENTKCEYSAATMNISSDEKTGNACDESNGWINSTCYYFNNGDDNEQTCSCIVDVDMFYAEGSNELRCCGDDSVSDVFCAGGSWYCHEGVKTLDGDVSSDSCSCFSQDWLSNGIGTNSPCCGDDPNEFFEQTEATGASCCYNASVLNSGNASGAILCYNGQLYDCNNQHTLGIETEIANCQEASDSGYYCDGDGSPAYWQYGIPDGCAGCQQNSECAEQTSFCDAENGAVEPLYGLITDDNKCFQCTVCGAGATRCSDQNSLCQFDCAADPACDDTAPYYCVVNETSDIYCDGGCLARDRDEAAEYCTKGDNDCIAFVWAKGGESIGFGEYTTGSETECCGDDPGENFRNTSISGTYYSACCDSATDCVNSEGVCIDSGESWNGYYCINGFWDFVPTHDTPYIGSHRKNESSLVGYWTLDNDAKDSSGNANHGTVYGDASNTREGRVGGAYEFDGDGDYIDVNDFSLGGEIAVCGWVYPTAHQNWQRLID